MDYYSHVGHSKEIILNTGWTKLNTITYWHTQHLIKLYYQFVFDFHRFPKHHLQQFIFFLESFCRKPDFSAIVKTTL